MLLLVLATLLCGCTSVTVCTTPDLGFNMLVDGVAPERVTSDVQIQGFDAALRKLVLTQRLNVAYTVRVLPSYGELLVRTRAGECDVGWAPFYMTKDRERCTPNADTCAGITSARINEIAAAARPDWEKYACCTDYSASYFSPPWSVAVMYIPRKISGNFFTSIFILLAEPFFVNFVSFIFLWVSIFAHLLWFAERRDNAVEFPPRYMDGIDDAIWWAAVTVSPC